MASGLIGTSTVSAAACPPGSGTYSGQTLSYTCPASGVRYAVITISAQASARSFSNNTGACLMKAGGYASAASCEASAVSNSANSVQIILAPGQSWSASASNQHYGAFSGIGEASLTASVLEIV